jgi:uncharacterized protein with ATP-grasp and redox domains
MSVSAEVVAEYIRIHACLSVDKRQMDCITENIRSAVEEARAQQREIDAKIAEKHGEILAKTYGEGDFAFWVGSEIAKKIRQEGNDEI